MLFLPKNFVKGHENMNNRRQTKRALLTSIMALVMCVVMLVGTTFAWFTDTATANVNTIKAGNLDIALEMKEGNGWVNAEGKTLQFKKAGNTNQELLWEPGCTYELPALRISNNGNLKLKYKIEITGIEQGRAAVAGAPDLNDVIEWTIDNDGNPIDDTATVKEYALDAKVGTTVDSDTLTIKGYMKKEAGNDYQGLTIDGVAITVYATQMTGEWDSNQNDYDADAKYPVIISELKKTYAANASDAPDGFVVTAYHNGEFDSNSGKTGTITIKDAESLLYFAYVLDPAAALANEPSTVWPHTSVWYGGSYDRHIVLDADIDLQGITLPNGFGNMKNFTFDGQGHTIKNATINYTGSDNVGLFVGGNQGISNLVVENIKVIAPNTTNAVGIVSSDANATINNVTVRNSSVTGGKYTGAVVGYNYGSVTNCTVENCTVSGRYKVGGVVGYICNSNDQHTYVTGNTLTGVTVEGKKLIDGKSAFVIGKIVGNWNATVGTCNNNTFSGTTTATGNIGEVESRCTVTQ